MDKVHQNRIKAIVLGASAGGAAALQTLLAQLPKTFPVPILVVQHIAADSANTLAKLLGTRSALRVKEAEECELIQAGTAYIAAANYHLLVETNASLSLSIDAPVSFARPSIDVLFESAAMAFGTGLIAVILTGANSDGSLGMKKVAQKGGITIVQDLKDAEVPIMPAAALSALRDEADYVVPIAQLGALLQRLSHRIDRSIVHDR